jgi:hypothetical protein
MTEFASHLLLFIVVHRTMRCLSNVWPRKLRGNDLHNKIRRCGALLRALRDIPRRTRALESAMRDVTIGDGYKARNRGSKSVLSTSKALQVHAQPPPDGLIPKGELCSGGVPP